MLPLYPPEPNALCPTSEQEVDGKVQEKQSFNCAASTITLPGKDYGFPQLPTNCCQQIYDKRIIFIASCSVAIHTFMNSNTIIIVITAIIACIDIPICLTLT